MRFNKRTIAIAATVLLLAGTGSAALLTNFANITGDTTAEQSVVLQDGNGYTTQAYFGFPGTLTGGDTEVSSETVENRGEADTQVGFGLTHTETRTVDLGDTTAEVEFTHSADEVTVELVSGVSASNFKAQIDNQPDGNADNTKSFNSDVSFDTSGIGNGEYSLRIIHDSNSNRRSDWIEQRVGQVYGLDTSVYEVSSSKTTGSGISVTQSYDTSTDRVTFNLTGYSGDAGAIYFDTDGDSNPEFQAGFYDQDRTTPRVKMWSNVEGTYEDDSRFDSTGEFDSNDLFNSNLGTFDNKVSGYIGQDYVTLRVDAEEFGGEFQYGVKDASGNQLNYNAGANPGYDASDDAVSISEQIGEQVTSPVSMDGESTRDFVFVNEFHTLLQPGDYGVTVDVLPAGN